jgi:8-oxo-dGTP diphosphatase
VPERESLDLRWVPVDEVLRMPLHPAFAAAWPALRELLP